MAISVNFGNNDLNSFLKNFGNKKKAKNSQIDFASMGRIRDAVIQQKQKDSVNIKSEKDIPTYTDKLTVCGVDYTNNPDGYKVKVPISDEIKSKIYENVKKDFETTGRRAKDDLRIVEDFYSMKRGYIKNMKGEDQAKTQWSLSQYRNEIHAKVENQIRELDPKWDWGQPVKKEVLKQIFDK